MDLGTSRTAKGFALKATPSEQNGIFVGHEGGKPVVGAHLTIHGLSEWDARAINEGDTATIARYIQPLDGLTGSFAVLGRRALIVDSSLTATVIDPGNNVIQEFSPVPLQTHQSD